MTTCARCSSPLEPGDLRCPICAEVTPAALQDAVREGLVARVMRCEGCGAATRYSAEARGLRCAFCAAVMREEEVEDPIEQAEAYLPFTVDGDAARAALGSWLGTLGWFRPPDLRARARVESLRPLWWVGWVFDAHALVSWTCDSNAGARRSDWAPHSGQVRLHFDDVAVSASRGLTDDEAYELVPSYDLATQEPAPGEVSGAPMAPLVEEFDVQRSQARQRLLTAIDSIAAGRVQRGEAPGSRFRNVHVACLLTDFDTRRLGLPAWVMAYRYGERVYRVVISGQDSAVALGRAPYSWSRIALAVLGVLLLTALVAMLVAA